MNLKSINSRLRVPLGGAIILAMSAALPTRADYQSTVLSQGPAGYWRLNETTQPAVVTTTANKGSLGSAADGTYVGDPTRALPGPFTGSVAVGFDGTSQYISTPYSAQLNTSSFSVELWVNPAQAPLAENVAYVASSVETTSPRSGWYMAQDNGSTFGAGSAFVVRLFNQNGSTPTTQLAAPVTKAAGSWYHIVLTYDGTTATLYEDGVAVTNNAAAFVPNVDRPTTFANRSDIPTFEWPGQQAEVAMYSTALSAARVAAHYTAGTTAPNTYSATVSADAPVLWYTFLEPPDAIAANSATTGSSLNGLYQYGTTPGQPGPRSPTYPGFETGNDAVMVPGSGGSTPGAGVSLPALNFNTNTVTISGWVNTLGVSQGNLSGIIVCDAGTTDSGIIIDSYGGWGLSYVWNGDNSWVPSTDATPPLPPLPTSDWAYVALVVHPDQAWLYTASLSDPTGFAGATNFNTFVSQPFDGQTLIGSDKSQPFYSFNGLIDEVAIWNRALGVGELYTQYGSAVGGLQPVIFGDLQGPPGQVAAGDPLVLTVDAGGTPPLTFYWQTNGVTFATTSSNTLVIGTSTLANTATYDVIISNSLNKVTSSQVPVTVVVPTAPTLVQLLGYQSRTLYPTGTLSMAVSATGGGLKYQWYKNASPIASATSSSFTIARVVATNAGSYSVSVTNVVSSLTSGPPAVITIPTPAAGSYEAAIVASGPEAWWRLDEPAGSTNMFDGMGRHDGVYTNAAGSGPLPTLGVPGALVGDPNTAASFSSTGMGIGLVPYSPALSPGKWSAEAWLNTTLLNVNQAAVSLSFTNGGGWWMQSASGWWSGGYPGGTWGNDNNVNTAAAIISGQWSYVVVNYDSTQSYPWTLYVNGKTDGYIWSGPTLATWAQFIIGAAGVSPTTIAGAFFDGQVDEVAVYPRLLTGVEISGHYAARGTVLVPVTFRPPLLSQTVTTGKSVSFSTTALGTTPISLQWYNGTNLIQNATNATYTIPSTALGDTGTYTLRGTNSGSTNSISASLTVISPVAYANVTNNLVLHLEFEGNTTDSSGRGNNGTPSTSTPSNAPPAYVPGIIGAQALQYATYTTNGSSTAVTNCSYVSLGTQGSGPPPDLQFGATTSFSISLWVKQPAGSLFGDLPFIGTATNSDNNPGWVLAPGYKTGGWEWSLKDDAGNGLNPNGTVPLINDGNWHNFVLTVDRTAAVANTYLDGVLAASTSIASIGDIDIGNQAPIVIGQDPTFLYQEPGTAAVDDIGIWRQVLTPLEVAQIQSAGSTAGRSFNTVGPQSVTITVARSGGNIVLNYPSGTLLQVTNLSSTNWTVVPGANPPSYTVTPTGARMFYRVLVQ